MLTPDQRRLIRLSYEALREQSGPVSLLFYGKLFEIDPAARRLFHNDLAAQGRKLMDTLEMVSGSLERFEEIRPLLAELGRKHATYGVLPVHYESLIRALIWALGQALGPDFDFQTRQAWLLTLSAVRNAMLAGPQAP
jgi:hemoglobin-like flavoprotein